MDGGSGHPFDRGRPTSTITTSSTSETDDLNTLENDGFHSLHELRIVKEKASTPSLSGSSGTGSTDRSSLSSSALTAERRRSARARLSAALSAVKPWSPPVVPPEPKPASAPIPLQRMYDDSDSRTFSPAFTPIPFDASSLNPPSSPSPETIARKTYQMGHLNIITSSSGWDIRLKELVMKEASAVAAPMDMEEEERRMREDEERLRERRRQEINRNYVRSRSLSSHSPFHHPQDRTSHHSTPSSPPVSSGAASPCSSSPSPPAADPLAQTGLVPATPSPSSPSPPPPTLPRLAIRRSSSSVPDPDSEGYFRPRLPLSSPSSLLNMASPTRRSSAPHPFLGEFGFADRLRVIDGEDGEYATRFSSIVTAYDERLREIVMEAARPAYQRNRVRRTTVAHVQVRREEVEEDDELVEIVGEVDGVEELPHVAVAAEKGDDEVSFAKDDGEDVSDENSSVRVRSSPEPLPTSTPSRSGSIRRRRKRTSSAPSNPLLNILDINSLLSPGPMTPMTPSTPTLHHSHLRMPMLDPASPAADHSELSAPLPPPFRRKEFTPDQAIPEEEDGEDGDVKKSDTLKGRTRSMRAKTLPSSLIVQRDEEVTDTDAPSTLEEKNETMMISDTPASPSSSMVQDKTEDLPLDTIEDVTTAGRSSRPSSPILSSTTTPTRPTRIQIPNPPDFNTILASIASPDATAPDFETIMASISTSPRAGIVSPLTSPRVRAGPLSPGASSTGVAAKTGYAARKAALMQKPRVPGAAVKKVGRKEKEEGKKGEERGMKKEGKKEEERGAKKEGRRSLKAGKTEGKSAKRSSAPPPSRVKVGTGSKGPRTVKSLSTLKPNDGKGEKGADEVEDDEEAAKDRRHDSGVICAGVNAGEGVE
ncbi:hypothetical protein BC829DRAFT_486580 [Chytridium lagenaria]|nr:hypothetical protein BC829DRAFT_486580 [Chytridium lagenaria]